jgi:hypothetical protein
MKICLLRPWLLTDEHPTSDKGIPLLVDLETCKVYHPGDRIGGFLAQKVVSLAVEGRGENNFLPEEIHFISRFKERDQGGNRPVRPTWEIWESVFMRK